MKRALVASSLLLPVLLLIWLGSHPELDASFRDSLFHFYVVTFTTFAAAVGAMFVALTLADLGAPRHILIAAAFAVMGALFFIHGLTTPGAVMLDFHPALSWAAWLTLFIGSVLFALAARTGTRESAAGGLRPRTIVGLALGVYAGFVVVATLIPGVLSAVDSGAQPWHRLLIFLTTFSLWVYASLRLVGVWRVTRDAVDAALALTCAWFALATVSMHLFAVWHVSWWLYHFLLLLGFLTAMIALAGRYEQLRQFSPTRYYATTGLITTAGLALLASFLFTQELQASMAAGAAADVNQMLIEARRSTLLVAGGLMGLLFVVLLFIVRRADRLIANRNAELARAYADLRAAETLRDDLTSMIVHDLRTPLTTIRLNLDLMARVGDVPEQRGAVQRFWSSARGSTDRMMGLIDDLLAVSKLEAGQLQPACEVVDVLDLMRDRATLFLPQAEAECTNISIGAPAGLPGVSADPVLIGRVLDNLISNALKYVDKGGHVRLLAAPNNSSVTVRVEDDGEGIPPEFVGRVFDKFVQATDARGKPLRKGTGLGLTFCRLAVEAHGGCIWVDSRPGQGTTMSFTLPMAA